MFALALLLIGSVQAAEYKANPAYATDDQVRVATLYVNADYLSVGGWMITPPWWKYFEQGGLEYYINPVDVRCWKVVG